MKKLLILLLIIVGCNSASLKDKIYPSVVVDEITSIYDGDTFRANIKSFPDIIGHRIGIRVANIDTPEMRGKCQKEKDLARKVKQATVAFLRSAKKIELRNLQRGKYFRIVADVYGDNKSLAEHLLAKELAVQYDGGTKTKDWCAK